MEQVPTEFLCPITLSIMDDPVTMPDGQTYERISIRDALSVSSKSPITKQEMKIEDAIPNEKLKADIDEYKKTHLPVPSPPSSQQIITLDSLKCFGATTLPDPSNKSNDLLNIFIKPPEFPTRLPISLIAMIDVSLSMGDICCESIAGLKNSHVIRLDLVKHSLKTIISTLSEYDKITIITFHTKADLELPPTKLDVEGKKKVIDVIESLDYLNSTNIWDALKLGIDTALYEQEDSNEYYTTSLMLFTDGEPTINPPKGLIPSLEEYVSGKKMNFTISSFGFGYSIDSHLLESIARIGNGIYGYCPDSTMVGTIFINYMAHLLCQLTPSFLYVKGPKINVKYECMLYSGSPHNFLFSLPKDSIPETQIVLEIGNDRKECQFSVFDQEKDMEKIRNLFWRNKVLNVLKNSFCNQESKETLESLQLCLTQILDINEELKKEENPTKWMKSLMIDLVDDSPDHGQVSKAFSQEYYPHWGKDYLRSFLRFHELELCGNFKDESLQIYAVPSFMLFRSIANKLFAQIPPPPIKEWNSMSLLQTRIPHRKRKSNAKAVPKDRPANYSFSSINSRFSGCFDGNSLVRMANNSLKHVYNLQKGDKVFGGARIECVIKMKTNNQWTQGVIINDAIFTPWHPIMIDGEWKFPADVGDIEDVMIDAWYNLVLSDGVSIILNGIEAVTLGHGLKGDVVEHPYFGTNKVIDALKKYPEWSNGFITISNKQPLRNEAGLIYQYY